MAQGDSQYSVVLHRAESEQLQAFSSLGRKCSVILTSVSSLKKTETMKGPPKRVTHPLNSPPYHGLLGTVACGGSGGWRERGKMAEVREGSGWRKTGVVACRRNTECT